MRNTVISSLLVLVSLGGGASLQAQPTDGETVKAVVALERQWLQSQKTNNVELLAPLLAEKFVATGADGNVTNRAETLVEAKATKWISVEYENLQVSAYANAAIATGVYLAKGTEVSGKPMDVHQRFTDTWVKMPNGKWQCVASHASVVKP